MRYLLVLFLLFFFTDCQQGKVGDYGYRLIKTVPDSDFDYPKLDYYFRNKGLLDSLGADAASIFEPKSGGFTIHYFLGDVIREKVKVASGGHRIAFTPLDSSRQNIMILKVMDSRIIVDGFLLPYGHADSISTNLFRVRTKDLQLNKGVDIESLNFRNLYNKDKRTNAGLIFLNENLLTAFKKLTKDTDVVYKLSEKVYNADFDYAQLDDFDHAMEKVSSPLRDDIHVFKPVAGNFIYYKFVADLIAEEMVFPEYEEDRDSFDKALEVYYTDQEYIPPTFACSCILILKTNKSGIIVDGYRYSLCGGEYPISSNLYRTSTKGVRLVDEMNIQELGFKAASKYIEKDEKLYSLEDNGRISLVPK